MKAGSGSVVWIVQKSHRLVKAVPGEWQLWLRVLWGAGHTLVSQLGRNWEQGQRAGLIPGGGDSLILDQVSPELSLLLVIALGTGGRERDQVWGWGLLGPTQLRLGTWP